MSWKASERLMDTIRHYAKFPATGVSLRQMVQFGEKPSTGTFLLLPCVPLERELDMADSHPAASSQAPSSAHLSFSPRSSPYASPIASRSWTSCPMASMRCRRSARSRIGMRSRSRYVTRGPRISHHHRPRNATDAGPSGPHRKSPPSLARSCPRTSAAASPSPAGPSAAPP
jgi:hypothetical protein